MPCGISAGRLLRLFLGDGQVDGKQIGVIVILLLILAVIGILFYVFIRIFFNVAL